MGLLDFSGFVGDDTTRDEFGVTQADRRQPLFTGLLKAGMLGMAAGENITPGQRAQLMGQIGGAIGDIPKGVQDVEAAGAQMQLRRQQFATNKQKLDQQRELQAYAQTPEFAEMLKGMPSHIQIGLNALIKAGDADGFQRLMSSYQTAQTAQAETLRKEKRDDAKAAEEAKKAQGGMAGTGERQQFQTWLMTEPPDSQRYARAHAYFSSEQRHNENGVWITQPAQDLKAQGYPDPTWTGREGGTVGGQWPPPGAPEAGQTTTDPNTSLITEMSADGSTVTQLDPKTGVKKVLEKGKVPKTEKPKPPSDTDVAAFHKGEAEAATLLKALEDYQTETSRMSDADRLRSLADIPTAANMATALAQLLAKGDVLLNLGVLTGDDMKHIQRILPDPSTFKGSVGDAALAVKKVSDIIKFKMQFREKQVFPYGRPGKPPAAPGGGGGGAVWDDKKQMWVLPP